MIDFKNLGDVLNHREETMAIDLLDHAFSMDEVFRNCLKKPEAGWYFTGQLEPFLKCGVRYQYRRRFDMVDLEETDANQATLYENQNTFIFDGKLDLQPGDEIVTMSGAFVINHRIFFRLKKYIKTSPTLPASEIKMAIGSLQTMVSRMCRHAAKPLLSFSPENIILPQFIELVHRDEYMHVFEALLDEVHKFIGKHTWNIYTYRLKGTVLFVEKGIDWRIYEYYRRNFEEQEEAEEE